MNSTNLSHSTTLPFSNQSLKRPYFVLLFLILNFQIISLLQLADSGSSIRFYHFFALLTPFLFPKEFIKSLLAPNIVLLYFIIALITLTYSSLAFGLNKYSFQLFFAYFIYLSGYSICLKFGRTYCIKVIKKILLFVFLVHSLKLIFFGNKILFGFYDNITDIPFIYSGGPNIEASWLALFLVFFLNDRKFKLLFSISLLTSILYASRSAFIVLLLILFFKTLMGRNSKVSKFRTLVVISLIITSVFLLSLLNSESVFFISRLSSTAQQDDTSFLRRLTFLEAGVEATSTNILGYGPGNSFKHVSDIIGQEFPENNVHNIYLQNILDNGVQSLVVFLVLIFTVISREKKKKFGDEFGIFFICYWIVSLLQFTGYESIFWFLMGIYMAAQKSFLSKKENIQSNTIRELSA